MRTWLARIFGYELQIRRLAFVEPVFDPVWTHELCIECGADEMTDHPDGMSGQCGACGQRQ